MRNRKDKRFGLQKKPKKDRSGQKFGKWYLQKIDSVYRYIGKNGKNKGKTTIVWYYRCECECGNIGIVGWPDISTGRSTKCKECHLEEYIINSQKGIKRYGKENPNYKGSEDVPGRWLSRARSNAEIRELNFNINLEDLQNQWVKQKGLCFYTGLPLVFSKDREVQDTNTHISLIASLDRTDSSLGYDIGNIAWVSKTINSLKMDLPSNLFVKACEMVYIYSRGKKNVG